MKAIFPLLLFMLTALLTAAVNAQEISFDYQYKLEPIAFDAPTAAPPRIESPQFGGLDVKFPEEARKSGVEGTVKVTAVLAEDGRVRDIKIDQDLPSGVGAAVTAALQKLTFKPATVNGKPVAVTMHLDYVVTLTYDERDSNVTKPQITDKPLPEYPSRYIAEKIKGKVSVQILFRSDGTLLIMGVSSVMPKEFDQAAKAAAAKIKFQPATHKKSKKPVTAAMTVDYDFKP